MNNGPDVAVTMSIDRERWSALALISELEDTNPAEQLRQACYAYTESRRNDPSFDEELTSARVRLQNRGNVPKLPDSAYEQSDNSDAETVLHKTNIRLPRLLFERMLGYTMMDNLNQTNTVQSLNHQLIKAVDFYTRGRLADPTFESQLQARRKLSEDIVQQLIAGTSGNTYDV